MYQTSHDLVDDWTALCQKLVPETLRQRDWRLVSKDELARFVRDVEQAIRGGIIRPRSSTPPEDTARRATIHRYCHELYRASGDAGSRRQHRAFEEIGRHAQGIAFRYEQDAAIVQECAQRAVEIVWKKREQVRKPGSFLRWIETIVYHEIKGYWKKKQSQREVSMSELVLPAGWEEEGESLERFWKRWHPSPHPMTS